MQVKYTHLGLDEPAQLKQSLKRLLHQMGREIESSTGDDWEEKWAQTLLKSLRKQPNRAQKTLLPLSSELCGRNPLLSSPTGSGREGEEPVGQDKMGRGQRRTLEVWLWSGLEMEQMRFWDHPCWPLSSSKPPSPVPHTKNAKQLTKNARTDSEFKLFLLFDMMISQCGPHFNLYLNRWI